MNTDALIAALSADIRPVSRHAIQYKIAAGVSVGIAAAALLLVSLLGLRPDLPEAASGSAFWIKGGYTLALGLTGLVLAIQLARPDSDRLQGLWLVPVPVLSMTVIAFSEAAADSKGAVQMITTARWICLPYILMLASPIYLGIISTVRTFAPTRLAASGAAAGLVAGGFGATIYGLYCEQASACYVLTRYTIAIVMVSGIGALAGRLILRW